MTVLLDTNVLVRLSNPADATHALAQRSLQTLIAQGHPLHLVPQVLYEFWTVATRPADVNGLGLTVAQARLEVERYQQSFEFFPDSPDIFGRWLSLVSTYGVSGKPTHDARLAAAMIVHGLDTLLTFNTPDFKRFDLTILHPRDVNRDPKGDPTP